MPVGSVAVLSAEFVMALPPFEISWPAPAMVLQPARTAVPASSSKAISRVMFIPLRVETPHAERGRIVSGSARRYGRRDRFGVINHKKVPGQKL